MMAISSPQYVWTLFTGPLNQKLGTTLAQSQWTFSLLIILQTFLSPLQAYFVDRFGPRNPDLARRPPVRRELGAGRPMSATSGRSTSLMASSAASAPASSMSASSADGALVSRPPRSRHRPRRRRLWLRRILHQLPDRQHDQELGLSHTLLVWGVIQAVIGVARRHGIAPAARRFPARNCRADDCHGHAAIPRELHAARDAAEARSSVCSS